MKRIPHNFPKISVSKTHATIEEYSIDDISWIEKYICHENLKMELVA
jgi:hypothetical protein